MVRSLIILSILASSCLSRTENHLSVSNPIPAGDLFPEVVELRTSESSGAKYICSGVFIKQRILLTAAHCTFSEYGTAIASISYKSTDGVTHQGTMFPSRRFRPDGDVLGNRSYDLAAIRFDTDVAPAVARLAKDLPEIDEKVTIVGFGITDINNPKAGIKNIGYNRILSIEENFSEMIGYSQRSPISILGGEASLGMNGDSGGGIFNQRGELSGIHSSGLKNGTRDALGNRLRLSYHLNMSHPKSIVIFREIDADVCADKSLKPSPSCASKACSIQ